MKLFLGDSNIMLKTLESNSVDAVVTDPPYGLSFMGKKWDYDVPSRELWAQVFRVMKPGAHLLSFGGTRTYHRMVVAIEDAGFEIRDQVMWIYGSGFPKSLDVSKAIDKAAGAEREVVGVKAKTRADNPSSGSPKGGRSSGEIFDDACDAMPLTAPSTDLAKQWQGWGTALKPANEPIVLARKPLEKGLTVAQNVAKWGTGAINVDAGRIEGVKPEMVRTQTIVAANAMSGTSTGATSTGNISTEGRWPANVLFDEEAAAMLDAQSGERGVSKGGSRGGKRSQAFGMGAQDISLGFGDSGGASRFFYVAKASKRERNAGLEGMPEVECGMMEDDNYAIKTGSGNLRETKRQNFHPTVKPIKLMEYLCKLITPPGGIILDPFMGSGSTLCAAKRLGYAGIGIEMSEEYMEIAKKRIEHAKGEE